VEHGRETPPACLAAAIVLLLGTKTSLLGGVGMGESAEGALTWCVPHQLPAPADADIGELLQLRDGLRAVFASSGGRRYAAGIVISQDMWSDDLPLRLRSSRRADGLWPAGYEMRWWTSDYDVGADVLVFGGAPQAREFFGEAASADCHRAGTAQSTLSPPGARNLEWVNPDRARQSDVFLLRGRRVYRVAAVRLEGAPAETPHAEQRAGAELVDALACVLPGADCAVSGAVSVVHSPR
jgi:hypothetical protein